VLCNHRSSNARKKKLGDVITTQSVPSCYKRDELVDRVSSEDRERLLEIVQCRRVGGCCGMAETWELVQMKPEE
jgi:hypothetical protein